MKTYKEVIEILKQQVKDNYLSGSQSPLYSVSQQFYIVSQIYGVSEKQVLTDVKG